VLLTGILEFVKFTLPSGLILLIVFLPVTIMLRVSGMARRQSRIASAMHGALRLGLGLLISAVLLVSLVACILAVQIRPVPAVSAGIVVIVVVLLFPRTRAFFLSLGTRSYFSRGLTATVLLLVPVLIAGIGTVRDWFTEINYPSQEFTTWIDRPDIFWLTTDQDGKSLYVSGNRNGMVWSLNPDTGQIRGVFEPYECFLQRMEASRDGRLFVSKWNAATEQVLIVDSETMEEVARVTHPDCAKSSDLGLDETNRRLYVTCEKQPVLATFDLDTLELLRIDVYPATRMGHYSVVPVEGAVYLLEAFGGRIVRLDPKTLLPVAKGYVGVLPAMARYWEEEGVVLVSRPLAGEILVLDAVDFHRIRSLRVGAGSRFFDIDKQGRHLFVGNYLKGSLHEVSFDDGEISKTWILGPFVRGVAYDPKREAVYTCSLEGALRIKVREES